MAAVGNGLGKSTGDEMDDVHAKEITAAAEKKARIAAKVVKLSAKKKDVIADKHDEP